MQDRFKKIRQYFGLSQAQFAQKINKSPGFISNVETGRSDVSDVTIHTICFVFGIDEEWLRCGSGLMFSAGCEKVEVDKDNVGERIRLIRKNTGLTQEQFAKAIGYSKMQVHYVEAGKVTPSNELLHQVAVVFNVNYDWIMTGEGKMEAAEALVDERLIMWLEANPDVVRELRIRGGLD